MADGKGSFRGVPFLTIREQRERGGRHVVKREYPLRESGGADDLGPKLPEFSFTVCVMGKDAQTQRKALTEALYAPGAGELSHPDFGALNVLIDVFDCRYSADELDYVEFTITAIPFEATTAPEAQKDTASLVGIESQSALDGVFDTLGNAWSFASNALHDAKALIDTVNDKITAIESSITGLGVGHDISSFMASLTAMRGNVSALITTPSRLAQAFSGIFSGLRAMTQFPSLSLKTGAAVKGVNGNVPQQSASVPVQDARTRKQLQAETATQIYYTCETLSQTLRRQALQQDLTGLKPDTVNTVKLLSQSLQNAVAITRTQMASELLTAAIERVSQQHGATNAASDNRVNLTNTPVAESEWTLSSTPLLESAQDIESVSLDIGDRLDECAIQTSVLGHTASALQIKRLRLALVEDLNTRGLQLPDSVRIDVRLTEPSLVTLYRQTGAAVSWQRFVRRNGIIHPLFVPGGCQVEVIDGE